METGNENLQTRHLACLGGKGLTICNAHGLLKNQLAHVQYLCYIISERRNQCGNFLFPRQIYFNVVVADTKALATSATTHIFSSCKLTIQTSIIFLQIYVIFSILSVK